MCWLCNIRSRQFEAEERETAAVADGEGVTALDEPPSGAATGGQPGERVDSSAAAPGQGDPMRPEHAR